MDNNSKIMRRTISILLVFNLWISLSAADTFCLDKVTDVPNLNEQIQKELQASTFYLAASHYFERSDMALHGISKFFHKMSSEEKGHADKLMTYMNMRKSPPKTPNISIKDICDLFSKDDICSDKNSDDCKHSCPAKTGDCTISSPQKVCTEITGTEHTQDICKKDNIPLYVMKLAHKLELLVYDKLVNIVKESNDEELKHFIEHEYLDEQIESIKQISDYEIQMARLGCGLGFYIFDQQFLQNDAKS
ncbi:ferritin-3, chloroplastic-like [Octopus vulgaris]|uniref:Ferritin n=1 Tax=Octopus vulgaris TaxID=6645 RepID=A0AA36BFL3_OCTVU|nr:ferritin-3, chloroplastic-like [Octopus vulgaris]